MKQISRWTSLATFTIFSSVLILVLTTLASDTINHNRRQPNPDGDLFPQLVKLVTFEKMKFDFAGIDYSK